VRDTNDKRERLLARITDITYDLCATVLRMEATKHVDVIGRLKADIERYTRLIFPKAFRHQLIYQRIRLLKKASTFVGEYDKHGAFVLFATRNQLGNEFSELERELDSFGARFRVSTIKMKVYFRTLNSF
jgi:hypothetical protein